MERPDVCAHDIDEHLADVWVPACHAEVLLHDFLHQSVELLRGLDVRGVVVGTGEDGPTVLGAFFGGHSCEAAPPPLRDGFGVAEKYHNQDWCDSNG